MWCDQRVIILLHSCIKFRQLLVIQNNGEDILVIRTTNFEDLDGLVVVILLLLVRNFINFVLLFFLGLLRAGSKARLTELFLECSKSAFTIVMTAVMTVMAAVVIVKTAVMIGKDFPMSSNRCRTISSRFSHSAACL